MLSLRQANIYEPHVYRHQISGTQYIGLEAGGWPFHTNFQVVRTVQSGDMLARLQLPPPIAHRRRA